MNDSYGHAAGDFILKNVASRLKQELRESDEVARLGGDEFLCIISPPTDLATMRRIARRLEKCVARPYAHEGDFYVIGSSIGVGLYPEHGTTPAQLLDRADHAMYQAKAAGGGVNLLP